MSRSLLRWRCCSCNEVFTTWAAVERHVDAEHGGATVELQYETEAVK